MIILSAVLLLACQIQDDGQLEFHGQRVEAPLSADAPLELSLEDALVTSFENNLALATTRLDTEAALDGFRAAWGDFDAVFFMDASRQEDNRPPSPSNFAGGVNLGSNPAVEIDTFVFRTGLRGMLTTGTTWQFDVGSTEFQRTVSGSPPATNFNADWRFSVTHPLLRGGSDDFAMTGVALAAHDVRIAALSGEDRANDIVQGVIQSYWNLVFAIQDAGTREKSVELANELLEITERKHAQGLQNRLDVITAEAELANRRQELLTARNTLEQSNDDLFEQVFAPDTIDGWRGKLLPVTDYAELPSDVRSVETAVVIALSHRPDILNAKVAVDRAQIELRRAENQGQSRLDLTGRVGINGQKSNLGQSYQNLADRRRHLAGITLSYEMSLGNRAAGYQERRRRIEWERSKVALREVELTAISEVRQESRNVALQKERVIATAETRRLRSEVYEGEKRRLENDLSTPFEVREDQRDLLEAIDNETRAQLDLATALTSYKAAQGDLLSLIGYVRDSANLSLDQEPPAP
ncbi:MAG: outer membrane protein [Pseudohongiellaceae bacterium]|jgi:outer membrane protein